MDLNDLETLKNIIIEEIDEAVKNDELNMYIDYLIDISDKLVSFQYLKLNNKIHVCITHAGFIEYIIEVKHDIYN